MHTEQKTRAWSLAKPLFHLAGGPGFEPELTVSETVVLPLDDPPNIE